MTTEGSGAGRSNWHKRYTIGRGARIREKPEIDSAAVLAVKPPLLQYYYERNKGRFLRACHTLKASEQPTGTLLCRTSKDLTQGCATGAVALLAAPLQFT